MSSRSGQGSNSRRQRSHDQNDDTPSIIPTLPSLRALNLQRERERTSPPPQRSAASRRAERIRNLDNIERTDDYRFLTPWDSNTDLPTTNDHQRRHQDRDLGRSHGVFVSSRHIASLLDMPTHDTLSSTRATPTTPPPPRPLDYSEDNRKNKRRKLDAEKLSPTFQPPRYGRYGQVEPGQLRMEIVVCDGGMFNNEPSYAAENILKDDASVYCTKGNRCNIVLRHQGGTTFTLSELVIKGPTALNYSHPIREGMVFVTMNQRENFFRTAQYQIQYSYVLLRNPSGNLESFGLSEDDRLHPQRALPQLRAVRHHHDDGSFSTSIVYRTRDDEYRTAHMPREFRTTQANVNITTECSDDDEDDASPRRTRRPMNRIGSLPFEMIDSDDDDDFHNHDFQLEEFMGAPSPHSLEPSSSLQDAYDNHLHATQEAVRAVGGTLLTPHARFLIENKKKNTCTIRFDPPVSGRYILLKMWNSHHDPRSNIDIQSIITRGFAGPRYFPSAQNHFGGTVLDYITNFISDSRLKEHCALCVTYTNVRRGTGS